MKWIIKLNLMDRFVPILGSWQRNRYLKSIQQGLELTIPLLLISSIILLVLNFPNADYQLWLRAILYLNDETIYQILNTIWVITSVSFVMGISYMLAESFNRNTHPGLARYRSFLSMIIAVTSYFIFVITDRSFLTGNFTRFPADILIAVITALVSSRIFIALLNLKIFQKNLHSDLSNPVLVRVYSTLAPAIITLSVFIAFRVMRGYLHLNYFSEVLIHLSSQFQGGPTPTRLSHALRYVFTENFFWLFGIDGFILVNDMNGSRLTPHGLIRYALFDRNASPILFSRTFFAHYTYLGGEGAMLSLVIAYWWLRIRTDYDKTIQLATIPIFFNINKLLLYGLPVIANPVFIIPFLVTPLILTIISYWAFTLGVVPPITASVSWYTPIFLSGYRSTGSIAGVLLQVINLTVGVFIYAPFLILSRRIRDQEFKEGRNELVESSMNRYVHDENFLNVRTDVVGSAARILGADLRVALRTGQLYLEYQPKINFSDLKIEGVEALVRWRHPTYGLIPPPVIISMAEENDMINDLSHWVITEAISQIADWRVQGLDGLSVGVNLSAREINNPDLADFIARTMTFYGVDPKLLEIEIVETMELTMNDMVQHQLSRLIEMGISVAIDDFGVGHGSAIYLKNFDINTLKVDKAISVDAHLDSRIAAIFNGVVRICTDLEVNMVIEHVETEEQLQYLVDKGGNIFQGYFFSKPLSSTALFEYAKMIEGDRNILVKSIMSEKLKSHSLVENLESNTEQKTTTNDVDITNKI